jgi:uncharacterized SAM-binding protein YcdF (DUF218 family)
MTSPTATVLIVFGRGVVNVGDGYALTPASAARVRAAAAYVAAHESSYRRAAARGPAPRVVLTGGWAEACAGAQPPPAGFREGDLMLREAVAAGLDRYAELYTETRSRSTLENLLHTVQDRLLADHTFTGGEPLGLVSHAAHLPRVRYLAGKVLRLRGPALLDVPATGGEVPSAWRSERAVHLASRLCFLGAHHPAGLLRRERRMVALIRRAERLAGHRPVAWQGEIGDVLSDASSRW